MPLYDYRCNACGEVMSVLFRSFAEEKTVTCESCGSEDVKRLLSKPWIPAEDGKYDVVDMDYTRR